MASGCGTGRYARIDWPSVLELAQRFAPLGIRRLRELRPFSHLAVPEFPLDEPGVLCRKLQHVWRLYRTHTYLRKKP